MGNKPIRRTAALVSVATIALLATSGLQAQQYPNPTTAAEVPGPSAGNTMIREYVQMAGRMAYFWVYALYDACIDEFTEIGQQCGTKHGLLPRAAGRARRGSDANQLLQPRTALRHLHESG